MKKCASCGELKDYGEFNKYARSSDGMCSYCRQCMKRYTRIYGFRRRFEKANNLRKGAWPDDLSVTAIDNIFKQYGHRCYICNSKANSIDHVVPMRHGGSNCTENMRPICRRCNSSKGNKIYTDDDMARLKEKLANTKHDEMSSTGNVLEVFH